MQYVAEKQSPAGRTAGLANTDLAINSTDDSDPGGTAQRVSEGANWLSQNWHVCPQPVTRTLREMFGLSFLDACKAIAEARRQAGAK